MINKFKLKKKKKDKKKKGFTLVELLAVIVILAVIMVITIPTVIGSMNNAKDKAEEVFVASVDRSLNKFIENELMYGDYNFSENKQEYTTKDIEGRYLEVVKLTGDSITLDDFDSLGYYSKNDLVNPKTGAKCNAEEDGFHLYKDKYKENAYYYKLKLDCISNTLSNFPIIDPDLSTGLIPVYYDESGTSSRWFVADPGSNWFNYDNHEWANAISVDSVTEGVRSKYVNTDGTYNVGKEIENNDMLAMFVWIPRFSYTIGCTSSSSCLGYKVEEASALSTSTPGAIDIKFVSVYSPIEMYEGDRPSYMYDSNDSQNRSPSNWYTHPAFWLDNNYNGDRDAEDTELSGIWVGKFETSVDKNSTCYSELKGKSAFVETNCSHDKSDVVPRILPELYSLVAQNTYSQFKTAEKISTNALFGVKGNSRMMKNSEWGAVAYLSQSIYGKYGNSNYSGKYKQIYKNDSGKDGWARLTGYSQTFAPATDVYYYPGSRWYNDLTFTEENGYFGPGASTTGTIYGVYDMVGGASEVVMAYYTQSSSEFGGYTQLHDHSEVNHSGFDDSKKPNLNYYNGYNNQSKNIFTKEFNGHAFAETDEWYGSTSSWDYSASRPWIYRGAFFGSDQTYGLFFYGAYDGSESTQQGFRISLIKY